MSAEALYWGRLCFEWFPGRFPSEIQAEIDRLPAGFVDEMIDSFSYAKAKARYEADPKDAAAKALVQPIEFAIVQEDLAERAARG